MKTQSALSITTPHIHVCDGSELRRVMRKTQLSAIPTHLPKGVSARETVATDRAPIFITPELTMEPHLPGRLDKRNKATKPQPWQGNGTAMRTVCHLSRIASSRHNPKNLAKGPHGRRGVEETAKPPRGPVARTGREEAVQPSSHNRDGRQSCQRRNGA